jgi:acetyl-CoA C-acetyltransferase
MGYAGVALEDIDAFDFYSCFPVAVSNAIEAIGLSPNDPRGLTVTGGLPYFGGPGNNYSLHAIAEMVHVLRGNAEVGLVAANGGFLSKYAVGVYSAKPCEFRVCSSSEVDAAMAAECSPAFESKPEGAATIETYTVDYRRDGSAKTAIVMGRLNSNGKRFLAVSAPSDQATAQQLADEEGLGRHIEVTPGEGANTFVLIN